MRTHVTDQRATARTDGPAPALDRGPSRAAIRRAGLGLTAGSLTWAVAICALGSDGEGVAGRIIDLTGLAFQLGVFCLLWVQMRTMAIGTSKAARFALRAEAVVLGLASVWSLLHGVLPASQADAPWLAVLDMAWPLSMLGMAVIAVKLAFAGRWRGVLRGWPLVAESWALVSVPAYGMFGPAIAGWVGGVHLVVGYATLGVLMALRPEQTAR
ncbi:hypothetical protein [Actinocorallia sp. A-T 12471]|uniref:hypothetical protein n=1 Tax=Actinocorallia sp. A-T 12471 TaxID=3089813 RepID=UPI0029CC0ED9|nr:hypothetical protein [Actinocorallia sp. A-T 12471]MDX6744806.1 hypothetical protein [Actinocorallia sp. A-T 12471]